VALVSGSSLPPLAGVNPVGERPEVTNVPTATGFARSAVVIDAMIVGWATRLVVRALRMGHGRRAREGHPFAAHTIHHSDAGSKDTAVHGAHSLLVAGMVPSVGSVGDADDTALAETTIGLYKTECVRPGSPAPRGPIATLAELEENTSASRARL